MQVTDLQQKLSQLAASESSLQVLSKELSSDKAALTAANQQLQQALMDKALESAAALDALRQQQAQQLTSLRLEHQQAVDQLRDQAATTEKQHKQVWQASTHVVQTLHSQFNCVHGMHFCFLLMWDPVHGLPVHDMMHTGSRLIAC